jgi:hypothetical protein
VGALFVLCAGLWVGVIAPLEAQQAALQARLATHPGKQIEPRRASPPVDAPWQAGQAIRQTWPPAGQIEADMARVLNLADRAGLRVDKAEYQYRFHPEIEATRISVVVPLKGGYGPLRQWVLQVLREHPHVALEELSIERESPGAEGVAARARWAAWFQGGVAQAASRGQP